MAAKKAYKMATNMATGIAVKMATQTVKVFHYTLYLCYDRSRFRSDKVFESIKNQPFMSCRNPR